MNKRDKVLKITEKPSGSALSDQIPEPAESIFSPKKNLKESEKLLDKNMVKDVLTNVPERQLKPSRNSRDLAAGVRHDIFQIPETLVTERENWIECCKQANVIWMLRMR